MVCAFGRKLLRLHHRSYTGLIADHLSSRRSSPIPFFIFGIDLTQLVRGVERLNQPLTQIYTHNARGVDKFSVRNGHMSEGIACEMAARLQLAVSLRDQVLHNRPIFNPNHWFSHTALHPSFRTGHWYHRANVCRTGFALLLTAIEIPMLPIETQGLFPEAINGRKFLPTFQSYLENVEKSATRPKMLSKCLEQASPKTEEASCVGGRSFVCEPLFSGVSFGLGKITPALILSPTRLLIRSRFVFSVFSDLALLRGFYRGGN